LKDRYQKASDALNQLGNSAVINAKQFSDQIIKIYTQFEEIKYISETIPDFILKKDNKVSVLKESGEIRVAQLLATILCDQIHDQSMRLIDQLDYGDYDSEEVRENSIELRNQVLRLKEVVQVQQKLASGAPVSTEGIKDLQKKYDARIEQLEKDLLRKEGRALTITALDATKKPMVFGKGKFIDNLADLILEYGKTLRASSGGYISLANLYSSLKERVPDIKFSVKDLEKACKQLKKQSLIEGISKQSGIKIVEFTPVSLGKDARTVFNLAVEKGYVTLEQVIINTKWDQQRVNRVLQSLVDQKIARKVTSLDSGDQYYFPGLYGDEDW
jgi:translation initiation factor 2B subunit (eIF-2B alpha/beta/delta family)